MTMQSGVNNHADTPKDLFEDNNNYLQTYKQNKNSRFKILFGLYKGHYGKLLLSSLFFIMKASPVWILPIVTSNIINEISSPKENSPRTIGINVLVISILILQNVPTHYLHIKYYFRAIRSVEAGLRGALVRKLQQLSISYYTQMQSGRLQSKIMRDVETIEGLSSQLFMNILNIVFSITISLAVTISKSIFVFSFFVLTIPIAVLIIVYFRQRIRKNNYEFRKEMEETSSRVMEMVEMVPVTRAHALEDVEIGRMDKQLNKVAQKGYRLDIIQNLFGSINWVAFQIFQVLCLGFSAYMAYRKQITAGDVILYQSYFATIVGQVSAIITLFPTISKGLESVDSIGEVLLAYDVEDNKNKVKLEKVKGNFDFENVHFHFKDSENAILSGLNLHVNAGETIAFVGKSGAGKSTILNLIIGFLNPTQGIVKVDGKDISKIDLKSYRTHLAVVPQNSILFSGTIRDNITYGLPDVTDQQLMSAIEDANLIELIESLPEGVDTRITEHGSNLSGGQRQRISIARALIRDPRIIILDEATSALDSVSEQKIQIAITNLVKNRTTFIVTHRLSTIKNADKIAFIKDGVCSEFGSLTELMELRGDFYEMRKLQE
jgi:ATP-binding cassette subfamily B protein